MNNGNRIPMITKAGRETMYFLNRSLENKRKLTTSNCSYLKSKEHWDPSQAVFVHLNYPQR